MCTAKIVIALIKKIYLGWYNIFKSEFEFIYVFTSHATISQSYMWRHIDVQADWRSCTYVWSPNAIDILQGSLTCRSYTDKGPTFLFGDSDTPPNLVAFYDTLGIRRTYSWLKLPGVLTVFFKSDETRILTKSGRAPLGHCVSLPGQSWSFPKVGQRSRSRSHVQNLWYRWKGLVTRNTHAKYESPICYGEKVILNVKVCWRTDGRTDRQSDYYRAPA